MAYGAKARGATKSGLAMGLMAAVLLAPPAPAYSFEPIPGFGPPALTANAPRAIADTFDGPFLDPIWTAETSGAPGASVTPTGGAVRLDSGESYGPQEHAVLLARPNVPFGSYSATLDGALADGTGGVGVVNLMLLDQPGDQTPDGQGVQVGLFLAEIDLPAIRILLATTEGVQEQTLILDQSPIGVPLQFTLSYDADLGIVEAGVSGLPGATPSVVLAMSGASPVPANPYFLAGVNAGDNDMQGGRVVFDVDAIATTLRRVDYTLRNTPMALPDETGAMRTYGDLFEGVGPGMVFALGDGTYAEVNGSGGAVPADGTTSYSIALIQTLGGRHTLVTDMPPQDLLAVPEVLSVDDYREAYYEARGFGQDYTLRPPDSADGCDPACVNAPQERFVRLVKLLDQVSAYVSTTALRSHISQAEAHLNAGEYRPADAQLNAAESTMNGMQQSGSVPVTIATPFVDTVQFVRGLQPDAELGTIIYVSADAYTGGNTQPLPHSGGTAARLSAVSTASVSITVNGGTLQDPTPTLRAARNLVTEPGTRTYNIALLTTGAESISVAPTDVAKSTRWSGETSPNDFDGLDWTVRATADHPVNVYTAGSGQMATVDLNAERILLLHTSHLNFYRIRFRNYFRTAFVLMDADDCALSYLKFDAPYDYGAPSGVGVITIIGAPDVEGAVNWGDVLAEWIARFNSYPSTGNIIAYNFIHDAISDMYNHGMYISKGTQSSRITGNTIQNASGTAIGFNHGYQIGNYVYDNYVYQDTARYFPPICGSEAQPDGCRRTCPGSTECDAVSSEKCPAGDNRDTCRTGWIRHQCSIDNGCEIRLGLILNGNNTDPDYTLQLMSTLNNNLIHNVLYFSDLGGWPSGPNQRDPYLICPTDAWADKERWPYWQCVQPSGLDQMRGNWLFDGAKDNAVPHDPYWLRESLGDLRLASNMTGTMIAGDFSGNGKDGIAAFNLFSLHTWVPYSAPNFAKENKTDPRFVDVFVMEKDKVIGTSSIFGGVLDTMNHSVHCGAGAGGKGPDSGSVIAPGRVVPQNPLPTNASSWPPQHTLIVCLHDDRDNDGEFDVAESRANVNPYPGQAPMGFRTDALGLFEWDQSATLFSGRTVAGDFNGDGKVDVAALYSHSGKPTLRVWTSSGSPDYFPFTQSRNWWQISGGYSMSNVVGLVAGDFDNSGRDDIAAFYDYGTGGTRLHVWLSRRTDAACAPRTAPCFVYQYSTGWWSDAGYPASGIAGRVVAGDFKPSQPGDEIAAFRREGDYWTLIDIWERDGTNDRFSRYAAAGHCSGCPGGGYEANQITGRVVAGQFDGQPGDDLAAMYDYGGSASRLHVWLSDGYAMNYQGGHGWWEVASGYAASQVTGRLVAGQFDGAGPDDIVTIYQYADDRPRTHVWLSTGMRFNYQSGAGWPWYMTRPPP